MIKDALTTVSSAQQVTADAVSTSSIDLGALDVHRQLGTGEPIGFAVVITAIGTTTGSAVINAIQASAATLDADVTHIGTTVDLPTASIAAGQAYFVPIVPGYPTERYIGLDYDITGTVEPVYADLPGWGALSVSEALPASLEAYIRHIEEATGVPVKLVSLGPDRAETLMRDTAAVAG